MKTFNPHASLRLFAALALPMAVMVACSEEGATTQTDFYPTKAVEIIEPASDHSGIMSASLTSEEPISPEGVSESGVVLKVSDESKTTSDSAKIQTGVLLFDTDKDDVAKQDVNMLQQYAAFLSSNPNSILVISGHADERGTRTHNDDLSQRRAEQVASILVSMGVSGTQLQVRGFGEDQPVGDPKNWSENRRVELNYLNPNVASMP